eukprot:tig00000248_g21787.t1
MAVAAAPALAAEAPVRTRRGQAAPVAAVVAAAAAGPVAAARVLTRAAPTARGAPRWAPTPHAYADASAPGPWDPFLNVDGPVGLKMIHKRYESEQYYGQALANNILAEFYVAVIQPYAEHVGRMSGGRGAPSPAASLRFPEVQLCWDAPNARGVRDVVISFTRPLLADRENSKEREPQDSPVENESPLSSFGQSLLVVDRSLYAVTREYSRVTRRDEGAGLEITEARVEVEPAQALARLLPVGASRSAKALGFVGSYVREHQAAIELAEARAAARGRGHRPTSNFGSSNSPYAHCPRSSAGRASSSGADEDAPIGPSFDWDLIASVLNPSKHVPGSWVVNQHAGHIAQRMNESQRAAVSGLRYNLESIQGPPGTGKSTTIVSIIEQRVPIAEKVHVTCTRNKAVDSVAEKLHEDLRDRFIVFGNSSRIGGTAKKYTLEARVERHIWITFLQKRQVEIVKLGTIVEKGTASLMALLETKIRLKESKPKLKKALNSNGDLRKMWGKHCDFLRRVWLRLLARSRRFGWIFRLHRVSAILEAACPQIIAEKKVEVRKEVLRTSRVYLSTIAATGSILRDLGENQVKDVTIHTAIVDEAACTPETSIPLLLRLGARNLVLVGDHKQLPPFTAIQDPEPYSNWTGEKAIYNSHSRSLMERSVKCRKEEKVAGASSAAPPSLTGVGVGVDSGGNLQHRHACFMLQQQYRMHPAIREVVSSLFYGGKLRDGSGLAQRRRRGKGDALRWHAVEGQECTPPNSKSPYNMEEVEKVISIYKEERARNSKNKIAIISLYKTQTKMLGEALKPYAEKDKNVEVITVDAAQGSEADIVILSLVRCNSDNSVGFANEPRRLCVAISRAKEALHVVGSRKTFQSSGPWRAVMKACDEAAAAAAATAAAAACAGAAAAAAHSSAAAKARARSAATANVGVAGNRGGSGAGAGAFTGCGASLHAVRV